MNAGSVAPHTPGGIFSYMYAIVHDLVAHITAPSVILVPTLIGLPNPTSIPPRYHLCSTPIPPLFHLASPHLAIPPRSHPHPTSYSVSTLMRFPLPQAHNEGPQSSLQPGQPGLTTSESHVVEAKVRSLYASPCDLTVAIRAFRVIR